MRNPPPSAQASGQSVSAPRSAMPRFLFPGDVFRLEVQGSFLGQGAPSQTRASTRGRLVVIVSWPQLPQGPRCSDSGHSLVRHSRQTSGRRNAPAPSMQIATTSSMFTGVMSLTCGNSGL